MQVKINVHDLCFVFSSAFTVAISKSQRRLVEQRGINRKLSPPHLHTHTYTHARAYTQYPFNILLVGFSYLLTSQLQPTDARKTFPCMDEPALKAKFTITVERREPLTSMSNTVITSTVDL